MARVLIIESDDDIGYLYQIALKFQKFEIQRTTSAVKGLIMLKTFRPNLVLLDVMVTDLEQSSFLEELKKESKKDFPVVLLTDLHDGAAEKEAAVYGACDYLNKNDASLGEIITSVRKAIKK